MMKKLSLLQKAGLSFLVALPLALGLGFNFNKNSKGLESKIPSIEMSTAQAKTTNPDGYDIPDFTGYEFVKEFDYDASKKVFGPETKVEHWKNKDGDVIFVFKFKGEIYGYGYGKEDGSEGYSIIANKQKRVYDEKYSAKEEFDIPDRLL